MSEADGVQRGLIEAGTRRPDLVALDLGLPDGDGIEFIRGLRAWSDIPVIVLSARTTEADKIAALDAGADDYLVKPFGSGELLARVRAQLRRHRHRAGRGLPFRALRAVTAQSSRTGAFPLAEWGLAPPIIRGSGKFAGQGVMRWMQFDDARP